MITRWWASIPSASGILSRAFTCGSSQESAPVVGPTIETTGATARRSSVSIPLGNPGFTLWSVSLHAMIFDGNRKRGSVVRQKNVIERPCVNCFSESSRRSEKEREKSEIRRVQKMAELTTSNQRRRVNSSYPAKLLQIRQCRSSWVRKGTVEIDSKHLQKKNIATIIF